VTLQKYLKELSDERKPLRISDLLQLSSLSSEELAEFKEEWASLSSDRKCETLLRLVELSEENLELDFSAVFHTCLFDDEDQVRETATRGLWECSDRVVIRPMVNLLVGDPSDDVRAAAAISLGKFAERAQDGKVLPRDAKLVRQALLSTISDELADFETKRRSIEAIANFGSEEIEEIIRDAYESDDARLKQSAIYAMGRTSDSQWLPVVLEDARHDDPAIRYEAATAIGLLGDEMTVPYLISLVKDDDSLVQLSAVHALGTIGGPLAKRALLQCLQLGDEALEEAAQSALNNVEFDEDPLGFTFQS
jgi:HEAT repeat protein